MTSRNLESWGNFIQQMWVAGGMPLLAVAAGYILILTPGLSTERLTLSYVLTIGGFLAWGTTTAIVFLRWRKIYQAQVYREDRRMADLVDLTKLFVDKTESVDSGTLRNFTPFMKDVADVLVAIMETPYIISGPQPGELPAPATRVSDERPEPPGNP